MIVLALNLTEVSSYTERHVEDTGPVHLVSDVDDMNITYQQFYQAKLGQYMAYPGQVAPGLIDPISEDVDGVRESGPDGNNTEDETKMEVLLQMAKMVMYNLGAIRTGRQMGMLCYPKMILLKPKWKSNSLSSVPTTLIECLSKNANLPIVWYIATSLQLISLKFVKRLYEGRKNRSNLFRHA